MGPDTSEQMAAIERLRFAGFPLPGEEVDELAAAAHSGADFEQRVSRRAGGEPLAWITGWTRFCGRSLQVRPGVFVPRPQSEHLAKRAAAALRAGERAADLCTGCGAIAAHLRAAVPGAHVLGVDLDEAAVDCAAANGVPVVRGDLDAPLLTGGFAVVTCVAPYVPTRELAFLPRDVLTFEPRLALDGGEDGLEVLRRVVFGAARLLAGRGMLFVELGGEEDRLLVPLLERAGFEVLETWSDGDGELRGLAARRN